MPYRINQRSHVYFDFYTFKDSYNLKELESDSKYALNAIKEAEKLISNIREYLNDLMDHANQVLTAEYIKVISIQREHRYYENKYYYYVTIYNEPVDHPEAKKQELERHVYTGKERHKAIKHYNELCKLYPKAKNIKGGF